MTEQRDIKEWELLGDTVALVVNMDLEKRFSLAARIRDAILATAGEEAARLFAESFKSRMIRVAEMCAANKAKRS